MMSRRSATRMEVILYEETNKIWYKILSFKTSFLKKSSLKNHKIHILPFYS